MAPEQHRSGNGRTELGRFLRARRAQVTPEDVGLPAASGLRRTPGLRREELATLAGVSIDYYARLERGTETRPSSSVIDALAHALRLGEVEHKHLRDLAAGADRPATTSTIAAGQTVLPGIELLLDSLRPNPAHVVTGTFAVLAANPGGLGLFPGLEDWPAEQRNIVRYVFLHPAARDAFDNWDNEVRGSVAWLRALAGVEPDNPDLTVLVEELLRKSPEFARLWDRYDVKGNTHGHKTFHHPEAGDLTLGYHGMTLSGAPGQHLVVYYSEPGSPDYDAMVRLDSTKRAQTAEPATSTLGSGVADGGL
ncbi:helix-turn-helix transcriptional regulator [Amycolatopsis sp. lyj-109]|uniref:helix-turn-helix transcriptional regulator n=1 Tax=Amycolatopsis sp. lyj-109 TaxID=2789287 RepID=UPI00397A9896